MNRLLAWIRNEVKLINEDTWEHSYDPVCTSQDPRCAALIQKQIEARNEMKKRKAGLLDGKKVNWHGADVEETFDTIRRWDDPPVRLIGRKVK